MTGPAFVLSTGRCGSTLLSRMFELRGDILSLSEVFSALQPNAFPSSPLTGREFIRLVSTPNPRWSRVLQTGRVPAEIRYDLDGALQHNRTSGVPPLSIICLAALTSEPDALLDDIENAWVHRPASEVADHYRDLFDWLARRLSRRAWIERSGGSLEYATDVISAFPDARVVHLHRDGADTALSMSAHPYFQSRVAARYGDSAVPQLEAYGRYWSASILTGLRALAARPAGAVLHLSYDGLTARPDDTLRRVERFLDLSDDPSWRVDAAALIDRRDEAWRDVSEMDRAAVLAATRVGADAIDRVARALT